MISLISPTVADYAAERVRLAREEHHALHAEFMRHISRAWDDGSDDWQCRTGGQCDEAQRICRNADAAGERWMIADAELKRTGWRIVR